MGIEKIGLNESIVHTYTPKKRHNAAAAVALNKSREEYRADAELAESRAKEEYNKAQADRRAPALKVNSEGKPDAINTYYNSRIEWVNVKSYERQGSGQFIDKYS